MTDNERLFEQLTALSGPFLAFSKNPIQDYKDVEYKKLRTHISLIIKLKTKLKNPITIDYKNLDVCIKKSCQQPASKYSTQFLICQIAIPIFTIIPPKAKQLPDFFEVVSSVICFNELTELAGKLFNIILKNFPIETTENICENIRQSLNPQSPKMSNYIPILSLLDFDEHSECVEKILFLLIPKATTFLKNKDFAEQFTSSIIQMLVLLKFNLESSICNKLCDEVKVSRTKIHKAKDILKRLIFLSIVVHNQNLLNKNLKQIQAISEGLKCSELIKPCLLLLKRIIVQLDVKDIQPIEPIVLNLPPSTIAFPEFVCQIIDEFLSKKNVDSKLQYESLSKTEFYECLVYHNNINDQIRQELIHRSINASRFDLLAKVANDTTIEPIQPYICELIRNEYPISKLVEYCTQKTKYIHISFDNAIKKIYYFNDKNTINYIIYFLTELLSSIITMFKSTKYVKATSKIRKIVSKFDIPHCNAMTLLYLYSSSKMLVLIIQKFARLLFEIYTIAYPDWKSEDLLQIPIYQFLSTYSTENLKKIFFSPQEIYLRNPDPENIVMPQSSLFILIRNQFCCHFIFQVILEIYIKSNPFKESMNNIINDINSKYFHIKSFGLVLGNINEYKPIMENLVKYKLKPTLIYTLAFTNEKFLEEMIHQISTSPKLTNLGKLIIYRHIVQKLNSQKDQTENIKFYKLIVNLLLEGSSIFKEFITNIKVTNATSSYILILNICFSHINEQISRQEIIEFYNLTSQSIENNIAEIIKQQENQNISISELIFVFFVEISCVIANSDSNFDYKKCFNTLNKLIHFIPIDKCIGLLKPLFLIASKHQNILSDCLNSIELITLSNCYIVGYFAITYYEQLKTDKHLALSIALALVTHDFIFPTCPDLIDLLNRIQWYTKPSRRRSEARLRKPLPNQPHVVTFRKSGGLHQIIPKENSSTFIANKLTNLTETFIKLIIGIICNDKIQSELVTKFVQILIPWAKNLKMNSTSKFRSLFEPFFNCTKNVHYYIMRTIFPLFKGSQGIILNEFYKRNCKANDYLLFYQCTESKDEFIQFIESKILKQQKIEFFMNVLFRLQTNDITESKLLALMYPFFDSDEENIIKCVESVLKKIGEDKPSLEIIFNRKGKEFENEFLLNIISFLGYKMDDKVTDKLFTYLNVHANEFDIEHMKQYINTMKRRKCNLLYLTKHFLHLYNLINENIKYIIYDFAEFLIQTDDKEIAKLAFDILKDKDDNDNLILQCIFRGTFTFTEIENYVKLEKLKKNYIFWYKMFKNIEVDEDEFPGIDDLYCALVYGNEELLQKIGDVLPDLIDKGFNIKYLLNYMFDIDNLNVLKIAPIFIAIPSDLYNLPEKGISKPDINIKLNVALIASKEHRDFIMKYQINEN